MFKQNLTKGNKMGMDNSTKTSQIFAQGCVFGGAICTALVASCYGAYSISKYLGRLVYPLSKYDDQYLGDDHFDNDFYRPNMGIRIHKEQYEQLSSIRKIFNGALLIFSGAIAGALIGASFTIIVVTALNPARPNPKFLMLLGTFLCSGAGMVTASLHEPKIAKVILP
jgi:hypothetical protein